MQKKHTRILIAFLMLFTFTSCEVIGDIFQAGMSVGIFLVIAVIAIILYVISKVSGK